MRRFCCRRERSDLDLDNENALKIPGGNARASSDLLLSG